MDPSNKTVLVTGGSGLIGRELTKLLLRKGYSVRFLSTRPEQITDVPAYKWDIAQNFIEPEALDGVDVIVHLAGANIAEKRWTRKRKQEIARSRIGGAKLLLANVLGHKIPLKAFISSSAIGYYGTFTSDDIFTEDFPAGGDFLAQVADQWEDAAWEFYKNGIRVGIVRTGVVLAPYGGLFAKLYPLAKAGLLSPLGKGNQWVPWIHIRDIARIYLFLIENEEICDVFNGVAPEYVTFKQLVDTLMKLMGKKVILPHIPEFAVKMMFGEMSSIMLYGSRVSAQKLLDAGFEFMYPTLKEALAHLLSKRQRK